MKTSKRRLGDLGEDVACEYLGGLGQRVLERNWRGGHLEVDVISADARGIHFVEVKSRTAPVSADPLVGVTRRKMDSLRRAALKYASGRKLADAELFFDLITVIFDGDRTEVEYYPQAFIPDLY